MDAAIQFLYCPMLSELVFLKIMIVQETGEKEEPANGNRTEKVREHLREEMEDVGAVQGQHHGCAIVANRMLIKNKYHQREAHRLDELGLTDA